MQRKDIKAGEIYAYSQDREDKYGVRDPIPFLVTGVQVGRFVGTRNGERDNLPVNVGRFVDPETLEPYPEDTTQDQVYIFRISHPGREHRFESRWLWRTWAEQIPLTAEKHRQFAEREERRKVRLAEQETEVGHLYALVPEGTFESLDLQFEPGKTPFVSVGNLIKLLEAARADAEENYMTKRLMDNLPRD